MTNFFSVLLHEKIEDPPSGDTSKPRPPPGSWYVAITKNVFKNLNQETIIRNAFDLQ